MVERLRLEAGARTYASTREEGRGRTLAKIAKIAKPEKMDFERGNLCLSSLAIFAIFARVSSFL
jgi:hypothetical protein